MFGFESTLTNSRAFLSNTGVGFGAAALSSQMARESAAHAAVRSGSASFSALGEAGHLYRRSLALTPVSANDRGSAEPATASSSRHDGTNCHKVHHACDAHSFFECLRHPAAVMLVQSVTGESSEKRPESQFRRF